MIKMMQDIDVTNHRVEVYVKNNNELSRLITHGVLYNENDTGQ